MMNETNTDSKDEITDISSAPTTTDGITIYATNDH